MYGARDSFNKSKEAPVYMRHGHPVPRSELRKQIIKHHAFPDNERIDIYRHLLELPLNEDAFEALLKRGVHPAFTDLNKKFHIKPKSLKKLQLLMSSLAHLAHGFSEIDYLPSIIYPFVKIFGKDELACFEIILSLFF